MPGFVSSDLGLMHGVETRTSAPVRIDRAPDSLQSTSTPGLYPCGEGAGYAGGIVSAAVDGLRVGQAVVGRLLALAGDGERGGAAMEAAGLVAASGGRK